MLVSSFQKTAAKDLYVIHGHHSFQGHPAPPAVGIRRRHMGWEFPAPVRGYVHQNQYLELLDIPPEVLGRQLHRAFRGRGIRGNGIAG